MRGSRTGSQSGRGSLSRRGSESEPKRRGSVSSGEDGPRVTVGAYSAGGKVTSHAVAPADVDGPLPTRIFGTCSSCLTLDTRKLG